MYFKRVKREECSNKKSIGNSTSVTRPADSHTQRLLCVHEKLFRWSSILSLFFHTKNEQALQEQKKDSRSQNSSLVIIQGLLRFKFHLE